MNGLRILKTVKNSLNQTKNNNCISIAKMSTTTDIWDDKYMGQAMIRLPEIGHVHYYDSNSNDHYFDTLVTGTAASGMRYPLGVNRTPKWPVWMSPSEDRYRFLMDLSHLHRCSSLGIDIILNTRNLQLVIQDRFHKGMVNEECLKSETDQFQLNMDGYNVCESIPLFRKTIQLPEDAVTDGVRARVSEHGLLTINVTRAKMDVRRSLGSYKESEDGGGVTVPIPIGEDSSSSSSDEELGVRE